MTLELLALDPDMKWELLTALAAGGRASRADIDAALALDNTQTGQLAAAAAHAAIPTPEAKAATWQAVVVRGDGANAVQRAAIDGFTRVWDTTLLEPYVEKYHAAAEEAWATRSAAIGERVVGGFYPFSLASAALKEASDAWLAAHPDAAPGLVRTVAENRDTISRALLAQARDAQG